MKMTLKADLKVIGVQRILYNQHREPFLLKQLNSENEHCIQLADLVVAMKPAGFCRTLRPMPVGDDRAA
jgi:hypothetical protein